MPKLIDSVLLRFPPGGLVLLLKLSLLSTALTAQVEQTDPVSGPLIFDPVLIQQVTLAETDENGAQQHSFIELSSLPSMPDNMTATTSFENAGTDVELLLSTQNQYQESILDFELEGGVYDSRLSEAYLALGSNHRQLGEYELAVEALNKSLQVSRINNGLFSAEQVPVVSELVNTLLQMEDIFTANQNQEYLFYILQKIYGPSHPVLLAEFLKYADWNLYKVSLAMGYIPNQQALNFRTASLGRFTFNQQIENQQAQLFLLAAAQAYSQVISLQHDLETTLADVFDTDEQLAIKNSYGLTDEDLNIPETEQKLAYTHFLLAQLYENFVSENAFGDVSRNYYLENYLFGKDALQRRFDYLQNSERSTTELVQALLDIADWFLLFDRWTSAKDVYAQIYGIIESNDLQNINGLVYPDLPVTIPNFLSSPYTRSINLLPTEQALEYQGYIDVSFSLNLNASPSRIRIINKSEGTTEATEDALIQKLNRSNFRLQLENQTTYSDNDYLIRYYYTRQLQD